MERRTISNSFTVNTIEDGKSAPYYFQEWYAWSNVESTLNVSTEPTPNSGWTTSIPSQGSYAYLWRKSIKYVWDERLRNYYPETAQYFRMSGTNGTSIKIKGSVPTVQDLSNISNPQDGDAYVVDATGHLWMWSYEASQWIDIGQFKGENGTTYFVHIAWATNVVYSGSTITSVEGFVTSKNPNDTTHLWMGILVDTNSGQDSDNATLYTWSYTKGVQGERGRTGRFYYYAGEFDDANEADTFVINDAQAPFFKHIESGQTRYHVFNPDENPDHDLTMNEMWAISSDWNNRPWEAMTNDFKYLITEAIFGNFAHFGSAIISGDWMISQHGTINGIASTDYTRFDSDYPNTDHEYQDESHNFIPNYCVDLRTGASYQQNAYVEGSIYTASIKTKFKDIHYGQSDTLYIGLDSNFQPSYDGVWNYRLIPNNASSHLDIVLPTNKYEYIGQRVIIYNTGWGIGAGQECSIGAFYVDDSGSTTDRRWLVGLSTFLHSSTEPLPANSFSPVGEIDFVNGIIEIMCIPSYDNTTQCDWCVVNIGTNFYKLVEL